jgi:3-oxoacyl-(acyl-carrier-protein) synthase
MSTAHHFNTLFGDTPVQLLNCYSSWEALDNTYGNLSDPTFFRSNANCKFATCGLPMNEVQVYILDKKRQLVKREQHGDVYIGTPAMFVGYLNDAAKTAERLLVNNYSGNHNDHALGGPGYTHPSHTYFTGDLGRIRADGQLEVMGRSDATVKIRAFKVSLGMVEATIKELDDVENAVVLPVLNEETRQPEALAAYVTKVPSPDAPTADVAFVTRLNEVLKSLLPEYAVPSFWVPMVAMPYKAGESRKLDRKALAPPELHHRIGAGGSDGSADNNVAATTNGDDGDDDEEAATNPETARLIADGKLASIAKQVFASVLGVDSLLPTDNFFELGGHSLSAARLVGELAAFGIQISIIELYDHPSIDSLLRHLLRATLTTGGSAAAKLRVDLPNTPQNLNPKLAIIGMSGKFPGADSIAELWENLKLGKDAMRTIPPEMYQAKGVDEEIWKNPDWVNGAYAISDADKFDAGFFGISRTEATIMDPQHRVFMQAAWEAMEVAGYPPRSGSSKRTGVFAACGVDGYLHHHFDGSPLKDPLDPGAIFLGEVGNEKDYIATRVSYALDLMGPAMNVNSACSSGLVAVAQAAQSIIMGDCDMAIAGAASVNFPNMGYLYQEGLVGSIDGKVRPFDTAASGTVFGDAVGAVVLKRLDAAEADGDHIFAVITGQSVTNDGRQKAGYSAPSATAQATAISTAMHRAETTADQVSYVECHATATLMGDGIELRGLKMAFEEASAPPSVEMDTTASSTATTVTIALDEGAATPIDDACPFDTTAVADDAPPQPWCALGSIKARFFFPTEIYTRGCHWIPRMFA